MFVLPKDEKDIDPNVFRKSCPARHLLGVISDKWSFLVIDALGEGPLRNAELMRRLDGVSQKMLTQTLRNLEEISLVDRHDKQTVPPHVEYSLTELGQGLRTRVCAMDRWIEDNMMEILPKEKISYR